MRKLMLAGLIFGVVVAGIGTVDAAGPRVTRVTPYSGIPKYAHMGETYQGELTAGAFGIESADHGVIGKSSIASIVGGEVVEKAVGLAVGPSKLKYIAAVAIQAGMLVGMDYFGDWLSQNTWQYSDGQILAPDPNQLAYYTLPEGGAGIGSTSYCEIAHWVLDSVLALGAACPYNSGDYGSWSGWARFDMFGWNGSLWEICWSRQGQDYSCGSLRGIYKFSVRPKNSNDQLTYHEGGVAPRTDEEVRASLEELFNGSTETGSKMKQGAMAAVAPSVNSANRAGVTSEPSYAGTGLTQAQGTTVQQNLDDSVTEDQTAEVEEGGQRKASGEADWEYTPEEMADAQFIKDQELDSLRKAEYDSYANTTASYDSGIETPDKDSLTSKLEGFMGFMQGSGSPISSLAAIGEVQSSGGSCVIQADLGNWGNIDFSFCEWGGSIESLGTIMLMMCGFLWMAWFFMGRGDA